MRSIRTLLVAGYAALCACAFIEPATPRVFWTMLMPALPLLVIVLGFGVWRSICPLAAIASLGARLSLRSKRRMPRWMQRHPFTLSLGMLYGGLLARLYATNGDGIALASFLVLLALSAIVVNAVGTGKSWCNYLCPVGVVERIYTDPGSVGLVDGSSRCARCSGCKKSCPDIDADRSYRDSLQSSDRRFAFYAFPGLVLGFYAFYWLRAGEWAAFFDGRWTAQPVSLLGPGLFFAPAVPVALAAPLVLALGCGVSHVGFTALERAWSRRRPGVPHERIRHELLAFASFVALNLFYFFAGAPALLRLPGAASLVAFVVPVTAMSMLMRSTLRGVREGAQPPKQIVTDKSLKLRHHPSWPEPCKAHDVAKRRRRALVVLT